MYLYIRENVVSLMKNGLFAQKYPLTKLLSVYNTTHTKQQRNIGPSQGIAMNKQFGKLSTTGLQRQTLGNVSNIKTGNGTSQIDAKVGE